uniref:Protein kinase domain-containing protein n=1 Tax=Caenorhabditis tropicalis TaxID=1561998 RepID=A0A1I7UTD6_9PELO
MMYFDNYYATSQKVICTEGQVDEMMDEVKRIAYGLATAVIKDMGSRLIPMKSYREIEREALDKAVDVFHENMLLATQVTENGSVILMDFWMDGCPPPFYLQDWPIYSGYGSEDSTEFYSEASSEASTGTSSGFTSESSSGATSRAASPVLPSTAKFSFGVAGKDFVFTTSAANAPIIGHRTKKLYLEDGGFEIVVDQNPPVHQKIKEFTSEELERQERIVEEFKKKVMG